MEVQKIGFGPTAAAPAGLIQFIVIAAAGIILFTYGISVELIVLKIIPATLFMLVALGHLALLGDNYPLSPPAGSWTPEKSRFAAGLGMTVIWAIFTFALLLVVGFIYPRWPVGPLHLWFGVIAFFFTLLYGINWNGWPFKGRLHPWATMGVSFIIIMGLSIVVWNGLTNLAGTPLAGSPSDHKGPLQAEWLTGYLVWCIAWFFIFNPVFVTQGWPFRSWGHPGAAVGQTILSLILGYICWSGSLALGMSPTLSFAAIASSIIFWSLVYSWHLRFWGITKYTHAKRAVSAIFIVFVLCTIWILLMRGILAPLGNAIAAAKLPADVNILIIYVNLCIVGPALIPHNAFWLRWPLSLPTPPGTPPPDQAE